MTPQEHTAKLNQLDQLMQYPALIEFYSLLREVEEHENSIPRPVVTLGQAMKFRRTQMGESVAQIAKRAGIPPCAWKALERDEHPLNLNLVRCLAAIGIPLETILQEP